VVGSDTVTVGEPVGSGSEGDVYRLDGEPEQVVKIFHADRRGQKAPKIRAMLGEKPADRTYQRKGVRSIIWPAAVATEPSSGSFLGYQMPYKDLDAATPAFEYSVVDLSWENSDVEQRFKAARNLAIMVRNVHRAGHAMGDFNDENILIDDGYVTLIDCDAFHISDGDRIHGDSTYHPRYSPPQKRGHSLTAVQESDKFCLGVHIFQFLLEGHHPYQAVGDDAANGDWADKIQNNPFPYEDGASDVRPGNGLQSKYDQLPSEIRTLFEECFGTGSKSLTWGRPAPVEWIDAIGEVADSLHSLGLGGDGTPTGANGTSGAGDSSEDGLSVPVFGRGSSDSAAPTDHEKDDTGPAVPDFGRTSSGTGRRSTDRPSGDEPTVPDFGAPGGRHRQSSGGGDDQSGDDEPSVPDFGSSRDPDGESTQGPTG
jgi:DNA-binding helix-hairpin-helix protein with protein kinase domain